MFLAACFIGGTFQPMRRSGVGDETGATHLLAPSYVTHLTPIPSSLKSDGTVFDKML